MTRAVAFPDRKKYKLEYSPELQDLISQLLEKNPSERIGSTHDLADILAHPFFEGIDLDKLSNKEIEASYKPEVTEDYSKYFQSTNNITNTVIPKESQNIVKDNSKIF